jgi:hypothetical protein
MGGETFELTIRALPDDDAPPIIRLRHVLKALLRAYRFRAVVVRDVTPQLPPLTTREDHDDCGPSETESHGGPLPPLRRPD